MGLHPSTEAGSPGLAPGSPALSSHRRLPGNPRARRRPSPAWTASVTGCMQPRGAETCACWGRERAWRGGGALTCGQHALPGHVMGSGEIFLFYFICSYVFALLLSVVGFSVACGHLAEPRATLSSYLKSGSPRRGCQHPGEADGVSPRSRLGRSVGGSVEGWAGVCRPALGWDPECTLPQGRARRHQTNVLTQVPAGHTGEAPVGGWGRSCPLCPSPVCGCSLCTFS